MLDDWFKVIRLGVTPEEFHQLPVHPAYKYEYYDKQAVLSPRPRSFHAILDLPSAVDRAMRQRTSEKITVRRLAESDWEALASTFARAFWRVPPFAALTKGERKKAAVACLERTRTGGEGPLIGQACFVADHEHFGVACAAILVTLTPERDLTTDWRADEWPEPPPPDAIQRRLGRPHLTWIFVDPWLGHHGVGSQLLVASARELAVLGYRELASTFLLGNDDTLLWHWRNGFRLLPGIGSMRRRLGDLD
jgi:hypothetical protein